CDSVIYDSDASLSVVRHFGKAVNKFTNYLGLFPFTVQIEIIDDVIQMPVGIFSLLWKDLPPKRVAKLDSNLHHYLAGSIKVLSSDLDLRPDLNVLLKVVAFPAADVNILVRDHTIAVCN